MASGNARLANKCRATKVWCVALLSTGVFEQRKYENPIACFSSPLSSMDIPVRSQDGQEYPSYERRYCIVG